MEWHQSVRPMWPNSYFLVGLNVSFLNVNILLETTKTYFILNCMLYGLERQCLSVDSCNSPDIQEYQVQASQGSIKFLFSLPRSMQVIHSLRMGHGMHVKSLNLIIEFQKMFKMYL